MRNEIIHPLKNEIIHKLKEICHSWAQFDMTDEDFFRILGSGDNQDSLSTIIRSEWAMANEEQWVERKLAKLQTRLNSSQSHNGRIKIQKLISSINNHYKEIEIYKSWICEAKNDLGCSPEWRLFITEQ